MVSTWVALPLQKHRPLTPVRPLRRGWLQLPSVEIRRQIIDRERPWSTCLDRRDNVRKVFLPGPFSNEFCELLVATMWVLNRCASGLERAVRGALNRLTQTLVSARLLSRYLDCECVRWRHARRNIGLPVANTMVWG